MFKRLRELLRFRRELTRDRFARLLVKRLQAAKGIDSVEYEPESFRLHIDGQQYLNLINFYDEHLRLDEAERENHIGVILQGVFQSDFELPAEFEDARHDLLPKVWPRAAFDRLDLQARVDGREPTQFAKVPLGPHLYLGLVYDLPKSVRTIGVDELDGWGISVAEALRVARGNLKTRPMTVGKIGPKEDADDAAGDEASDDLPFTPPREYTGESDSSEYQRSPTDPDGSVYLFVTGDSYDATRLVLIHELDQLTLAGRPVAISPNRDALLVAGSEDEQAIVVMASLASQMYEGEPRPHVPIPMVRDDDGRWDVYQPPRDHPAFEVFHALEVKYLAEEYSEQKPLLEKLYEREYLAKAERAEEVLATAESIPFVASLLVAESDDGRFESHAVWAETLETLLPKADVVAFMKKADDAAPIQIPWADVMAVLDDLVTELPDHYPPRYQVREFPSDLALRILTEDNE